MTKYNNIKHYQDVHYTLNPHQRGVRFALQEKFEDEISQNTFNPNVLSDEKTSDYTDIVKLQSLIKDTLSNLTPRESKVLQLRFGIDMHTEHTLKEISDAMGTSPERIRQIEAKALRKLRHPSMGYYNLKESYDE